MKIEQLAKLPLNEVLQHVSRETLIIMIANQQLSYVISYCNTFQLNGLELSEVLSRYDKTNAMKMELIKGLFIHCPNAKNSYFVDTAISICSTIIGDDNAGRNMTARMYVSIFKNLSKHHPEKFIDVDLLKRTGHFTVNGEDYCILEKVLKHGLIDSAELPKIFNRNDALIPWFKKLSPSKMKSLPIQYHDAIIRHQNRLKLNGVVL